MQLQRGAAEAKGVFRAMNKRQTEILKILYKNRNYITFSEIASQVSVSVKTVRNDIAAIKETLASAGAGTIESRPHVGIRLVSIKENLEKLSVNDNDSYREIIFFIIRHLFRKNELTAQRLAQQYYLTRAQLEKILEKTSKWFFDNRIVFERKRGKGISIRYSEFNYRAALANFCMEYTDMYSQLTHERDALYSLASNRDYTAVCAALDGFDVSFAAKAISEIEQDFGFSFSCISGAKLLFMLSLGILRTKNGFKIEMPVVAKCVSDGKSDLKIAEAIAEKLKVSMGIDFSEQEISYIAFCVAISEINEFETEKSRHNIEVMNVELCVLTVKTVNLLSEITGIDLRGDRLFVSQMFIQLKACISRLKYGIAYENKLLSQIKSKYPNMMAAAWLLGNVFEKELGLEINEHEAAGIALITGGSAERHTSGVSACIVCDYGIGVSRIIREKLSRALPELRITDMFSRRDMRRIKNAQCDFIITTVPLDGYRLSRGIIEIKHLPDEDDIRLLEEQMRKIRLGKKAGIKEIMPRKNLFNKELIFPLCSVRTKKELLQMMCARLELLGYVTRNFEKSVFEREHTTSTDIGKGFAVPHGLGKYVNRSAAVFASLAEPIEWGPGGETADIVFLLAFDLDDDKEFKNEIIAFYKSIVTFMEDDKKCESLRELSDKEKIMEIFNAW